MAYTFAKDLTTNTSDRSNVATDSYDFSLDYGPSNFNQPQTFTSDFVYDLPFFKGQHGVDGKILGGWQVSGITAFLSGQSFSLSQPHDPWDPNGLNVGLGISSPRPDQIAPVQMTKTVGDGSPSPRLRPQSTTSAAKAMAACLALVTTTGIWQPSRILQYMSGTASSFAASSSMPSTTKASVRAAVTHQPLAASIARPAIHPLARSPADTHRVGSRSERSLTSSSLG